MLSFVLLAYDWFVLDADLGRAAAPFRAAGTADAGRRRFAAGAGRIALLMMVEYPGQTGPDWRFALVAVDAFWRYLGMFFVPRGQSIFHAVPFIDSLFSPARDREVSGAWRCSSS